MDREASRADRSIGRLVPTGSGGEVNKSNRLLVPLDGSGLAERVLPHAASLAQATSSVLTLLQVVPPLVLVDPMGVGLVSSPSAWEAWEKEPAHAREYLAGIAGVLRTQGVEADTMVLVGDPTGCIIEYARQHPEVRMIAMATHGRSGIHRWILGSVAERVLHSSPVPLLLVRVQEKDIDAAEVPVTPVVPAASEAQVAQEPWYRTIMVPLDGSPSAEQALEEARLLAARFNAAMLLLSVVPPFEYSGGTTEAAVPLRSGNAEGEQTASVIRYLSGVAERLRDMDLKVQQEVVPGNPAEEILRRSEAGKADLIVMASHGRSGLQRLWLGSVAMKVVQHAKVPVLLLPESTRKELPTKSKLPLLEHRAMRSSAWREIGETNEDNASIGRSGVP